MSDRIKVKVIEYKNRKQYLLCYTCPLSGKRKWQSSGVERTGRKRERDAAERAAGAWEKQLNEGTYQAPSKMTWESFRERYENEVLPSLAVKTQQMFGTVFNHVEAILSPVKLADLTADRLSYFQSKLRAKPVEETTIRTYLAHLKSALGWAVNIGLLRAVPKIQKPQRAAKGSKVMKGRPIATEEFERMLGKVAAIVGDTAAPSWKFYLRGLWASGLRLAESLEVFWDRQDKICIDTSGKRPMMRIHAGLEKGNQDRLLPLAPEFAELLLTVPEGERRGRVFKLVDDAGNPREFGSDWTSRVVCAIGEKAGIKVNVKQTADGEVVKFASAHDLRRSFGERWASRVMPQVLQQLMRHESIETTLKYYVGRNAQTTADVLWAAHEQASNTFSNSVPKSTPGQTERLDATDCHVEPYEVLPDGLEPSTL